MLQAFVFVTNRFEYYMERGVFCQAEWAPGFTPPLLPARCGALTRPA